MDNKIDDVIEYIRNFVARIGVTRILSLLVLAAGLVIFAGTCGVALGHDHPRGKGHGPTSTVTSTTFPTSTTLPGAACATAADVGAAISAYCKVTGPLAMFRKCRRGRGRFICTRTYLIPTTQVQPELQ